MDIEIRQLDKDSYGAWDRFCLASDSAWFRHTTRFLEYILNCRFAPSSKNLSFGAYQNGKLIAIAPLVAQSIYEDPEILEFALHDTNIPFPAFDNGIDRDNRERLIRAIFQEIDRLAAGNGISYGRFLVDPLSESVISGRQRTNPLLKLGYHETSLSTNIVYLKRPEKEIFADIFRGHKANINSAIKNGFTIEIYDKENIAREVFDIYKNIHLLDAGRKTRPDESWEGMYEFIKHGEAFLAMMKRGADFAAGILVIVYKGRAYYGSGATHPGHALTRGVGHLLQWKAMEYLAQRAAADYYEIGWNFYPGISQKVVTAKEANISTFKARFGGELYPVFRGEKFYSKEYLLKIYADRINKYSSTFDKA